MVFRPPTNRRLPHIRPFDSPLRATERGTAQPVNNTETPTEKSTTSHQKIVCDDWRVHSQRN